ncbi:MAG: GNAT family N-acetyltransferase [Candidatus Latescibacteria bacterium]|nr:GNAT family N-acetyltransferase [Candidatus Latescibacterota bacterium]
MQVTKYSEDRLNDCAAFWWQLYHGRPYLVRPDGYEHPKTPSVGRDTFVDQIEGALGGRQLSHWGGEVSPETILLAVEAERVCGVILAAIKEEEETGYIRSGFMGHDSKGMGVAEALLDRMLSRLCDMGMKKAVLGASGALEAESPLHIAALNAGFACAEKWVRIVDQEDLGTRPDPGHIIWMGGPIKDFKVGEEMHREIERLRGEGITLRQCTLPEVQGLRRQDTGQPPDIDESDTEFFFVALCDGQLVGWTGHTPCRSGQPEIMAPPGGPHNMRVVPSYRRRGIGKVLFHLATAEYVRLGAEYGYGGAGVYDPLRRIMRSVGYQHWYAAYPEMSLKLI